MEPDLARLPFDHFQRYATAVAVLKRFDTKRLRILEVGANRQRLLSRFFPEAELLYTDIVASGDDADFVVASAAALPFGDRAFDAVVCLDVLEHIPADLRESSVMEMARVASRLVIIGCPTDEQWVRDAESSANSYWDNLFGGEYPWLAEHQEFGLVDASAVEAVLAQQVQRVFRVSQGDPKLWAGLMAAHFMKERTPSLGPLVASLDHFYNAFVFDGDFPVRGYREFFLGIHSQEDAQRVSGWTGNRINADKGVVAFLQEMPQLLRPIVDGVVRIEEAWKSAISMYQHQQSDLAATKDEWGKTAAALERVRESEARLSKDLDIARSGWEEAVATLERLRVREATLSRDLDIARSGWEEAVATLERLRAREATLSRDLDIARSGWEEAVATLKLLRAREATLSRDLDIARSGWEEAVVTLGQARAREASVSRDFEIARAGWEEAVATLRASHASLTQAREDAEHLRADLNTAKSEWSATARLLGEVQFASSAQVADLNERLVQTQRRLGDAEDMVRIANLGRRRAVLSLVAVVVISIAAITTIALP